jgi:hypothetical protein
MLNLEDCNLAFLHAGDQSFNVFVFFAQVILDLLNIHEIEAGEVGRMVLYGLLFVVFVVEGSWDHLF